MGNFILKNDVVFLHCSNWAMEMFHQTLKQVLEDDKILSHNEHLISFLENLDQEVYGRGCIYVDTAEYFGSHLIKPEVLYNLTTKVINKISQAALGEFKEGYIRLLTNFKNKIMATTQ